MLLTASFTRLAALLTLAFFTSLGIAQEPHCKKTVYLTFDTGHMGVAPWMAKVLQRQNVKVTFFAAQEKTQQGDGTLGQHWAPWWRDRVAERCSAKV